MNVTRSSETGKVNLAGHEEGEHSAESRRGAKLGSSHFRHILQGILIAVSGAFLWLFCFALLNYEGKHKLLTAAITAAFGLPLSAVFVVPLGATLGLAVPFWAERASVLRALVLGAMLGVGVTAITTMVVAVVFQTTFLIVFMSMLPVCTVFLSAWIFLLRRPPIPRPREVQVAPGAALG